MEPKLSIATELIRSIVDCYYRGGKVLICGNGGLTAEAEHFAAELMGTYGKRVFIPCIALTTNSSLVTALANDMGFGFVFSHQIEFLGRPEDLVICMTTSNSANIVVAVDMAIKCCIPYIKLNRENIEGNDTAEIQENILKLLHKVAREAKEIIYAGTNKSQ